MRRRAVSWWLHSFLQLRDAPRQLYQPRRIMPQMHHRLVIVPVAVFTLLHVSDLNLQRRRCLTCSVRRATRVRVRNRLFRRRYPFCQKIRRIARVGYIHTGGGISSSISDIQILELILRWGPRYLQY